LSDAELEQGSAALEERKRILKKEWEDNPKNRAGQTTSITQNAHDRTLLTAEIARRAEPLPTDKAVIPEAYEYTNVTEEAVDLLENVDDRGMLPGLNNNVKRILTENEITYNTSTKPEDAINALRAKATAKEKPGLSFKEVSERLGKRRLASAKKKKLDNIDKFFLEVTENLQKDFDKAARSFDEKKIPKSTTNTYKRDFNKAIEKDDITEDQQEQYL
jgi:hypothetical protein